MRPALPQLMLEWSALPDLADGGAAAHVDVADLARRHPELRVGPVLGDQLDAGPAERAIFAPPPGRSSIACTTVPVGMLRSGRLLPTLMSAAGRPRPVSPCLSFAGAMM
jgi:hypothetical protein